MNQSSLLLSFIAALCIALILVLLFVAALSRRKKAGAGELKLVGQVARVEIALEPEGAVLVGGELWRARARTGVSVTCGTTVTIAGARGHLLIVEAVEA